MNNEKLDISCRVVFSSNKWNKKEGSPSSFWRKRQFISLNSSVDSILGGAKVYNKSGRALGHLLLPNEFQKRLKSRLLIGRIGKIGNLPSFERARAHARANHAKTGAQKGCAMQLNGITLNEE